jgi:hypothetical protein
VNGCGGFLNALPNKFNGVFCCENASKKKAYADLVNDTNRARS